MNKASRSIIVLCILCVVSLIGTITVYAKDAPPKNIELTGGAKGLLHIPNDKEFLSNLQMIPGSSAEGKINIKNTDNIPYNLKLEAQQITKGQDIKLLDKINLIITYNGEEIYNGPISEQEQKGSINLGNYEPMTSGILEAKATLSSDIGNEYKNKYGEVKWIFTAVADVENTNTFSDSSNGVSNTIPTALRNIYKTGNPLMIPFIVVFISSLGIIMFKLYMIKKRGEKNEKQK